MPEAATSWQPLAGCLVAVRRLWPGALAGRPEVFELPAAEAKTAIAAGLVMPVYPDADPVNAGPLGNIVRSALETDAELRGLLHTVARYRSGVLRRLTALPRGIVPAAFTTERFRAQYGERPAEGWYAQPPEWTQGVSDPRATLLARHLARRRAELLTGFFDELRSDAIGAVGLLPSGASIAVPPEVWSAASITLDLLTGAIAAAGSPMFASVTITPPAPPEPAKRISRASVERFVTTFAAAMLAADRTFIVSELTAVATLEGIGASEREVADTLHRLKPTAWARRGRRSAAQIPSAIEIADAARQARQSIK